MISQAMDSSVFSEQQQRIIDFLADGKPHKRSEVIACIGDSLADRVSLQQYLTRIRKRLPQGEEIIAQYLHRTVHFRHIRHLHS